MPFISPYAAATVLSGVIEQLPDVRPEVLFNTFGDLRETDRDTVNFDIMFGEQNVIGQFMSPDATPEPITLGTFGHVEIAPAYTKAAWNDPVYSEISTRQLGQPLGITPTIQQNFLAQLAEKGMKAEQRRRLLIETAGIEILTKGSLLIGSGSRGDQIAEQFIQYGRPYATTLDDVINGTRVHSANLTTTDVTTSFQSGATAAIVLPALPGATVNGTAYAAGAKSWSKTNIDALTATPYQDMQKMFATHILESGRSTSFVMDYTAFQMLAYDIDKNYADSADITIRTAVDMTLLSPLYPKAEGFTRVGAIPLNGALVQIYTYNAIATTLGDGVSRSIWPAGFVAILPPDRSAKRIHTRIMHGGANWDPMEVFINRWQDPKSGAYAYESHSAFVLAPMNMRSWVSWKVM